MLFGNYAVIGENFVELVKHNCEIRPISRFKFRERWIRSFPFFYETKEILFILWESWYKGLKTMYKAINKMVLSISKILIDCLPTIYLYGSVPLNDFKLGWSDIDILCLTKKEMSQAQANELVNLRQKMSEDLLRKVNP